MPTPATGMATASRRARRRCLQPRARPCISPTPIPPTATSSGRRRSPSRPTLVADIDPGAAGSAPHDFVAFNGAVYFAAHDGSTPQQNELWETKGSSTQLVQSFSPSATDGSYVADEFAQIGSNVLFVANDGVDGPAVWSTDGTTAGTSLIAAADPTGFATLGGSVYFLTSTETSTTLWETNGTAAGTAIVATLPDGPSGYDVFGPQLVVAGGKLFFVTSDGTKSGEDLWASDGTSAGTSVAKDFNIPPDRSDSDRSGARQPDRRGGPALLHSQRRHSTATSSGSATAPQAGTVMVSDINPTGSGGDPSDLTPVGSSVYFVAYDSSDNAGLWVSNGQPGGTIAGQGRFSRRDLPGGQPLPGPAGHPIGQSVDHRLAAVGSTLYFSLAYVPPESTGSASDQFELWTSNGSYAGTSQVRCARRRVPEHEHADPAGQHRAVRGQRRHSRQRALAHRRDGRREHRWSRTSTPGLEAAYPTMTSTISRPSSSNGVLYFAATDGTPGQEIWQTDGTAAGTSLVADIDPGVASAVRRAADSRGRLTLGVRRRRHSRPGAHERFLPTSLRSSPASRPRRSPRARPSRSISAGLPPIRASRARL